MTATEPTIETGGLSELVRIDQRKRELKDEEKALNARRKQLEEQILDDMIEWEIQPPYKVNGMTVYVAPEVFVSPIDGDRNRAIHALRRAGLEEFVKEDFNTSTLKAWVKEQLRNGEELPEELTDGIKVTECMQLRCRKG